MKTNRIEVEPSRDCSPKETLRHGAGKQHTEMQRSRRNAGQPGVKSPRQGELARSKNLTEKKLQGEANSGIQSNKGRHPQIDPETEREA